MRYLVLSRWQPGALMGSTDDALDRLRTRFTQS